MVQQLNLPLLVEEFEQAEENAESALERIPGLKLFPEFISENEQARLVRCADAGIWEHKPFHGRQMQRRSQDYGYKYDADGKTASKTRNLPQWLLPFARRLVESGAFPQLPDQVLINEYWLDRVGIGKHTDAAVFGEIIGSLSLISPCLMWFYRGKEKWPQLLEPRSLLIMQGQARQQWQHGIPPRKTFQWRGRQYDLRDQRRLSFTFRQYG